MTNKHKYKEFLEMDEILYTKEKEESKTRIFREFIMFVVCLLAIIYANEVRAGDVEKIDIAFLSIELSKIKVVALVPSIIMLVNLLIMSCVERLITIRRNRNISLFKYQEKYPDEEELIAKEWFIRLNSLYLPGAIRINSKFKFKYTGLASFTRIISVLFISIIYSITPYFFSIFVISVTYSNGENRWLLAWNILTVIIMFFYSTSITLGAKGKDINELYYKDKEFIPTRLD